MKKALHYLVSIEIHGQEFDWDIESGSDYPAVIDQEIPTGLSTDHESSEYRLPPLFSDRLTFEHIPSIPFWHSLTHVQTETKMASKVNNMAKKQD